MERLEFDTVIIGMGLGAAAIAQRLAGIGARIAVTPGVGCARFKHLDGGVVSPSFLESAFGTSERAPLHDMGTYHVFRRDLLEQWAIERLRNRVTLVPGFDDLRVVPHEGGGHAVHEESGTRLIVCRHVILTEGASPKIGIAAGIRPDFEPEDLLHFGRTILPGVHVASPAQGVWRTSWGMPAWYSVVPHPEGAIVGASARIENIMRVGRDGREVVTDFLRSPLGREIGIDAVPATVGMELVPLQRSPGSMPVEADGILITPDASGVIDPRSLTRYEDILQTGVQIGDLLAGSWPTMPDWSAHRDIWQVRPAIGTPYHDSSDTGFIEEGAGKPRGLLGKLVRR